MTLLDHLRNATQRPAQPAGDLAARLLWLVPLTQAELDFKVVQGVNALLARLTAVQPPWIFEASTRPANEAGPILDFFQTQGPGRLACSCRP